MPEALKRPRRKFPESREGTILLQGWFRGGCLTRGVIELNFCEQHVKTGARVYQKDIVNGTVKPLNVTLFGGRLCIFQQNSAPVHQACSTWEWLQNNILDFTAAEDWLSSSPDLNSLDYKFWTVLEGISFTKSHCNLKSLKKDLMKAAKEILMEVICCNYWVAKLSQGVSQIQRGPFSINCGAVDDVPNCKWIASSESYLTCLLLLQTKTVVTELKGGIDTPS